MTIKDSPGASGGHIADGHSRHLHPASLALAMLRMGPQSLNLLPAIAVIGATGRWALIAPAILLFLAVGLIVAWLKWFRFTWRVDQDSIAIDSGILSRNSRDIPFDRIQDVAIEQGLLARMFRIATVSFDTGSAEADSKEEGKLAGIALAEARALREHIRYRRAHVIDTVASAVSDAPLNVGAPPAALGSQAEPELLYTLRPQRLFLAGLFNFSLAIFAILFGLLNSFDQFLPFDPFEADVWVGMAQSVGLGDWVLGHSWLAALAGTISVLMLGLVTGIAQTVVRDWNFRLEKSVRGLRRTRGLTTRTDVTLPISRVQATLVESGLIRRQFGWFSLKVQSLASDSKGEADHVIAPFARLDEIDLLLDSIGYLRAGHANAADGVMWHRSHPVGMVEVPAILLGAALLAALPISVLRPDLLWACGVAGLLGIATALPAWLAWRSRQWHFDGRMLHLTSGLLRPRHIMLPVRNIQSIDVRVGPIARRLDLAETRFGVAGGGAEHAIVDMPFEEAIALREKVLARGDGQ